MHPSRTIVRVLLLHMILQHIAVTELLLADVAFKRFDAGVLCYMSFQVVCRRKPSTAILTAICVHSLVHIYVNSECSRAREKPATLLTLVLHIRWVSIEGGRTVSTGISSCVYHRCLEHNHSVDRRSLLTMHSRRTVK